MSCRETSGNSATTSLVKFITGASEKLVSHEFHRLRREGKEGDRQSTGDMPADANEVTAFLSKLRLTAQNDSRIKESRRMSLQHRIDQALVDAESGRGPNQATFYAWTNLQDAVESNNDFIDSSDDAPVAGRTPEGLEISLGDVQAAWRMAQQEHEALQSRGLPGRAMYSDQRYARKVREISTLELRARAERLQAAFDATDVGYDLLQKDAASSSDHPNHVIWSQRVALAQSNRERVSAVAQARDEASSISFQSSRDNREAAFARVKHYERLIAAGKQDAANSEKLQQARKSAQHAQRVYLYKVAQEASVTSTAQSKKLSSPSEWAELPSLEATDRFDIWRSAELIAADMDRARVRVGRIPNEEATRRELMRARARQAILDSEGQGVIDPVNKRFAAAENERRILGIKRAAV